MVTLTINLSNTANRIVELYKTNSGLKNKEEVLETMVLSFKSNFSEEQINADWRNDPATERQKDLLKKLKTKIPKNLTKLEADQLIKEKNKKNKK